jgi:uncharacterized protein (TIGR03435 family)
MSEFTGHLSGWVTPSGEPTHYVSDKTGLTGAYDFTLKFDASRGAIAVGPNVQAAMGPPQESEPSGLPNIAKAIEQQLGLKLVRRKDITLDTIAIDEAQRIPAGN